MEGEKLRDRERERKGREREMGEKGGKTVGEDKPERKEVLISGGMKEGET